MVDELLRLIDGHGVRRTWSDRVSDSVIDIVESSLGVSGRWADIVASLVYAPDMHEFRKPFDRRESVRVSGGYGQVAAASVQHGVVSKLHSVLFGGRCSSLLGRLFSSTDPTASEMLGRLHDVSASSFSPDAVAAVLMACAYRRKRSMSGGSL